MLIRLDDLRGPEIADLLQVHLDFMATLSPPESRHALDLEGIRTSDVTFWTAWGDGTLLGCGALKELTAEHGEIKSMHTAKAARGQGVAAAILETIPAEAGERNYRRLSLETGSMAGFRPAHKLYERYGFLDCPPFGEYVEDPNSVFMTLEIR
ncbi:MAG: GNAT family N-acetyltransferase [Hyphomicrobiales bacterium]|nr:GNAT family N-acetyltransferase [Hyphomicrobiales bacterium]MCP4999973.1 GNAT family N-acetyltransferase [Hyphomicrobiales bacterium]